MVNSKTRCTRPGDHKTDADIPDEYIWSVISYLDPEQQNGPSNFVLWVSLYTALLIWGSLWVLLLSL